MGNAFKAMSFASPFSRKKKPAADESSPAPAPVAVPDSPAAPAGDGVAGAAEGDAAGAITADATAAAGPAGAEAAPPPGGADAADADAGGLPDASVPPLAAAASKTKAQIAAADRARRKRVLRALTAGAAAATDAT